MLFVRRFCLGSSLLILCVIGCDGSQPVEPALQAASTGSTGPTPKAPSNTNALAVSHDQIDVSWQDNSSNETGFEVHRSTSGPSGTFSLRASTGANVTGYRDTPLNALTQYCYKVRAFRTFDGKTSYSEFSTSACATTPAPPVPTGPSGTDAKPASTTAVDVSWIDNSTNEDGFRVERSLNAGATWTSAGTVGPNVTSSNDGGRTSEQQVCYRVIAFNAGGDSPPSAADCTTPPAGPSGLTATTAPQGIDLTWTDNSAVEDGYQVQRAPDGVSFSALADLPANSTSYHDAGATTNATYWYRVRAKKDGGVSDFSNVASAAGSCVPTNDTEVCGNSLDDNCDGLTDSEDPACSGCQECGLQCPPGFFCGFDGCCVAHCGNGARDGNESDLDCGADCPTQCSAGQHCYVNADCASGSCVNDICQ